MNESEQIVENTVLGLKMPTDPRWVDIASLSLEYILTDHAFCEQKAATQCISIIQKYSDRQELVDALAPIVTEEWGHFRQVLAEIKKRGYKLGRQRKDEYVNLLLQQEPSGITQDEKLLHKLMICALIEARSCERFRLLSKNLTEEHLRKFYHHFMVAEAGHYRLFLDLAKLYFDEEVVKATWNEWLLKERNVMTQLEPRADRMH